MSQSQEKVPTFSHEKIETSNFLMIVLILLVVAVGGLGEIVPLFNRGTAPRPAAPDAPYKPSAQRILQLSTEFIRVLGLTPVVWAVRNTSWRRTARDC